MRRRTVLVASLPLLAGCVRPGVRNSAEAFESTTVPLGEAITHDGWELAVLDWTTADSYRDSRFEQEYGATDGTTFLFAELFVRNASTAVRYDIPSNLTFKPVSLSEPAATVSATIPFEYYLLAGTQRYRTYQYVASEADSHQDGGLSPDGEITGWQAYRIPVDYEREQLAFRAGFGVTEYFWTAA